MKIDLQESPNGHDVVIDMGTIRVVGYLKNGKTCLRLSCLGNGDFMLIEPSSANQITVKADKAIK